MERKNIYNYKPFGQYENGRLKKWYGRLSQVEKDGYKQSDVEKCLNGKKSLYYGFSWRYAD